MEAPLDRLQVWQRSWRFRTSAGTAGFSMTSGNNQFAVIEVDTSELPSGQSFLLVNNSDKDNLLSVVAILSGARQKYPGSVTVQS